MAIRTDPNSIRFRRRALIYTHIWSRCLSWTVCEFAKVKTAHLSCLTIWPQDANAVKSIFFLLFHMNLPFFSFFLQFFFRENKVTIWNSVDRRHYASVYCNFKMCNTINNIKLINFNYIHCSSVSYTIFSFKKVLFSFCWLFSCFFLWNFFRILYFRYFTFYWLNVADLNLKWISSIIWW